MNLLAGMTARLVDLVDRNGRSAAVPVAAQLIRATHETEGTQPHREKRAEGSAKRGEVPTAT